MAQTRGQRKRRQGERDRARLGDKEYKHIEEVKMRIYRASKLPPPAPPAPPAPPPAPPAKQPQANRPSKKKQKAPQQAQRAPQQVVKYYVPLYKSPNATSISDNSYSDDRDENIVPVKDNQRIINFEPKNIKTMLNSISDKYQKSRGAGARGRCSAGKVTVD